MESTSKLKPQMHANERGWSNELHAAFLWLRKRCSSICVHLRPSAVALALLALALTVAPAVADDEEARRAAPPSLDELLGLTEDEQDAGARDSEDAARREADEALRRRLEDGQQMVSRFAQAIEQMIVSADLLDTRFDPGVGTQRIQEDIMAKLDDLIAEACRQCASSSSSSSSSQGQREPNRQPQEQPQDRQGQADQRTDQDGECDEEGPPPRFQQGDFHTEIAETRQEWGALPERIREMLLQGRQERFSSLYEQLTRDYYRRLASE